MANVRGIRLVKPQDIRRMLSRLINQTLRGELDVDLLRAVSYASSVFLKSIEVGELADRLTALEQTAGVKK